MIQQDNLDMPFSLLFCVDKNSELLVDVFVKDAAKQAKDIAKVLYAVNAGTFEDIIKSLIGEIKVTEPNKKKMCESIIKEYNKLKASDNMNNTLDDEAAVDPFDVEL